MKEWAGLRGAVTAQLRENRAAFIAELILGLDRARAILDAADARAAELEARDEALSEPRNRRKGDLK